MYLTTYRVATTLAAPLLDQRNLIFGHSPSAPAQA
jgi:hypothetical protein